MCVQVEKEITQSRNVTAVGCVKLAHIRLGVTESR